MTLTLLCQELEKAAKNVIRSKIPPTRIIEIVFLCDTNLKENSDPLLHFWKPKESQYPRLAILARKCLCVQATSNQSERVSSKMGTVCLRKETHLLQNTQMKPYLCLVSFKREICSFFKKCSEYIFGTFWY